MLKSYKTEILPTIKQTDKIRRSMGICRWLYNEYIARTKRLYRLYLRGYLDENQKHFMSAMDFDKFVNHKLKNHEERAWINECGSKARKKSITNAETAFKKFFKGETGFQGLRSVIGSPLESIFQRTTRAIGRSSGTGYRFLPLARLNSRSSVICL